MSITPEELKEYTEFESVKKRSDDKLTLDILEAESYIEERIDKPLNEYAPLPDKLRIALLKVAQFFALVNSDESIAKGYKSEKIGDYSYTLGDGTHLNMPDVSNLLSDYFPDTDDGNVFLRIRSL